MQIAIAHYHLNRGGVTQVIANHLRALHAATADGERSRVLLLYGGRREGWPEDLSQQCPNFDIRLVEVGGLEYDDRDSDAVESPVVNAQSLADDIIKALTSNDFAPDETLLHIHNHALGKNASLPGAVAELAASGVRMLLQIHDFAEDFRPDLYGHLADSLTPNEPDRLPALLYPQGQQIHYAVLNARDRNVLSAAGVTASHLHWLPNPVAPFESLPPREEARQAMAERFGVAADRTLLVYPVRGIRRKNLGEMLLLAAAADRDVTFATTLTPLNPTERTAHDAWRSLATECELPCLFGVGDEGGLSFGENLSAADALVTTSVAEGFGMVFLEAWLAGRPLVGRNLADITSDFVDQGLRYEDLYDRLAVPIDWIGEETFRQSLVRSFSEALAQYGREHELAERFEPYYDELIEGGAWGQGTVDFASLDVELQRQVIVSVSESDGHRDELLQTNRWMQRSFLANAEACREEIEHNAKMVRENYSLEVFGGRLLKLYQGLLAGTTDEPSNVEPMKPFAGNTILDTFLDVRRFRPIRTEVPTRTDGGDEQ